MLLDEVLELGEVGWAFATRPAMTAVAKYLKISEYNVTVWPRLFAVLTPEVS